MFSLAILIISLFLNLLLGLFVLLKNPKSTTHRLFFALTFFLVTFSLINYVSLNPIIFDQLTWIRLDLVSASYLFLLTYLTFDVFPAYSFKKKSLFRRVAVGYTILVSVLTLTPLVFSKLETIGNSVQPVPAPGIGLFVLQQIGMLLAITYVIVKKYKSAVGRAKEQLRFIVLGISIALSSIIFFNLVLVQVFKITQFIYLSNIFALAFTGSFSYAVIRKRLFNVRTIVARSVAYVLLLASAGAFYSIGVFGLSALLLQGEPSLMVELSINMTLALLLTLTFPYLKRFFEKQTDKVFFRDRYDSQKLLNEVTHTLAQDIILEKIMDKTLKQICHAMRVSFGHYLIFDKEKVYKTERYGNFPEKEISIEELKSLNKSMLIADELESGLRKEVMDEHSIRVSIVLRTKDELVGYLLLGDKLSGDIYTGQDISLFEILANELAVAIVNAKAYEQIQRFNITLQEKVNDATRQLRRTNEKLKELDETKDEFISMASHQLRTPLTSMKGYVSMVLEGDAGKISEMQRKLLDQAFVSSQRMVYLIADLLNVSRLKTGKFVVETKPTNLADVIEGEISQLYETAKGRGLELTFEKPHEFPLLMLDETKIRQVIMNFADNAIYYTPSGGHIRVNLEDKGETVDFTVVDNGLGVPKHEQHHLFSKFYRAGNAKKARPDGTGLGLFMAKKVIVAQGGSIIFRSEEGKGSTFGFSFAKAPLNPSADNN